MRRATAITGAITNATWTTAGRFGSALLFNGNGMVTINDAPELRLTTAMTLSAWVNPSLVTSGWRDVIYKGLDVYFLEATSEPGGAPVSGGKVGTTMESVVALWGPAALPVNTWSHLATTWDGATLRLYVNGTQVASGAVSGSLDVSTEPLQIGGDSLLGQFFLGMIDEVRVYNVALTQPQIQADMKTAVGGGTPDTQPPTDPSGLTATAAGATQINLSWTASTDNVGVTGYRVERCEGASCVNFVQVATPPGASHADSGLAASTTYRYRVRATDGVNFSGYSNEASATTAATPDTQPPTDPSGLTATAAGATQINLSWTASTDNVGVTGYRVERCQGASCVNFVQVATPTGASHADIGLAASTTYRYRVRATDGVNFSGYSNEASATTAATPDTQPPTDPSGLTATAAGATQINLSWTASTDNVGVTGYRVERCQGASCVNFVQVATPTGASHADSGLAASTTYRYRVRATDGVNFSGYSNEASATTAATPDTQPPTAPSGLTATAAGATQINLSWTASTDNVGVTGYRVERCQGASCVNFVQVATPTGASHADIGLAASTTYRYRVRATDGVNFSGYSNEASATTAAAGDTQPPTAPSGLAATAVSSSQINLNWTASTDNVGVTGYLVERCQGGGCTNFTQIGTPTATSFSSTGLSANRIYRFRVRAVDAAGNLSPYSNVASARTNK